jgi:16S rRNA (cytidine1402-2'-O)-methyltransferase
MLNPKNMLYIVSTPIGNLDDMSYRAVDILRKADVVVAEDSRRTFVLSNRYGLGNKKIIVFNEHNEHKELPRIIKLLKEGKTLALTTDSGTPGISDPGFLIVREAVKEGIHVAPVPGACAFVSALVCSGLPSDRFVFHGFVSKKPGQRKDAVEKAKGSEITSVFYESPHRIHKTLDDIAEIMPERQIAVARELTKRHEEFVRGTAKEVSENFEGQIVKGEMVVIIAPKPK